MATQTIMPPGRTKRVKGGKKAFLIVLLIVAIGIFVFSAIKLVSILTEYSDGDSVYNDMREYISDEVDSGPPSDGQNSGSLTTSAPKTYTVPDFTKLLQVNSDTVGWIRVYDTNIDYPVVKGDDNEYYLTHTIKGTENGAGTIFLDHRNSSNFSDKNTIIYGHNMNNGSMFADLNKYKDKDFFNAHRYIKLFVPSGNKTKEINLLVFSAYVSDVDANFNQRTFSSNTDYMNYLKRVSSYSAVETDVSFTESSRIVTLCTCTNHDHSVRYVVHALVLEQ